MTETDHLKLKIIMGGASSREQRANSGTKAGADPSESSQKVCSDGASTKTGSTVSATAAMTGSTATATTATSGSAVSAITGSTVSATTATTGSTATATTATNGSTATATTATTTSTARVNKHDKRHAGKAPASDSTAEPSPIPEGFHAVRVRDGVVFTVLDRYQDLEIIGTGAQGIVW